MNTPAKLHMGVSGRYRLQVVRPDGSLRRELEFPNLVTNAGLRYMYNGNIDDSEGFSFVKDRCYVGSDSTPPALTDTQLGATIAYTRRDYSAQDMQRYDAQNPQDWHCYEQLRYDFPQGAAAGNISEIGLRGESGSLFSRALVLDENGQPTTITVLSDEFLIVNYEFRIYPFASGAPVTGTVDGYDYKIYPIGANQDYVWSPISTQLQETNLNTNWTGGYKTTALPDPFDITTAKAPFGTQLSVGDYSVQNVNYDNVNHTVIKRVQFSPTQLNGLAPDPVRSLMLSCIVGSPGAGAAWVIEFTPGIAKDNTKALTIDFLLSWGNFTPA